MSALDMLLKIDRATIEELPTTTFEIPRLTELMGGTFELTLRAINGERMAEIQKSAIDIGKKGGVKDVNLYLMQIQTLIEGVTEPSLKDKSLLDHYDCTTPKDLIKKLFLAGEISDISNAIQGLSGFDKVEDEELKK